MPLLSELAVYFTDMPQCAIAFLDFNSFQQKLLKMNLYQTVTKVKQLRIFPDISFMCSGNLTMWIIAGKTDVMVGAELQIWRRGTTSMDQNNYTLVGSSVLPVSSNSFVGVYNYTPNPPLAFQEGDILGVYQRNGSDRVQVYYQETTGPANYHYSSDTNVDPPLGIANFTDPVFAGDYAYPLVAVKIGECHLQHI